MIDLPQRPKENRMQSEVPLQVAIRVRPLLGPELSQDPCLYCVPNQPQIVLGKSKSFTFDYVFPQPSSQKAVYMSCVHPLISVYFEGYNTTVFAYGQTGSGKTYTMATGNRVYLDEDECGIIPRAVTDIFNTMEKLSDKYVCKLRISFIEVYKEELKDLLDNTTTNVQVMDDENGNTVVMGVQEEAAQNVDEVLTLLDAGTAMRHVGSTNMNEESSRSHCIFTLILDQYPIVETEGGKGKRNVLSSRFHFVDLAGSERAQRTGNQGERFKESISINTGLLALGNVISALAERRKDKHVPYRESKLTRILKDSLGGNSRTLMITCLSPALIDLDENINSLKYAERARKIRNTPIVNFDMESSKITQMETEIEALRGQLQRRQSTFLTGPNVDVQKISDLEIENEKRDAEQNVYLQQLHEINIMLQAVELTVQLPSTLKTNIESWRKNWQKYHFDRPITAPQPSRGSAVKRPQNDALENLRNELSKCKQQLIVTKDIMESKNREIEEMQEEIGELREINAQLHSELNADFKKAHEYQDKMVEQQIVIEGFRNNSAGSIRKSYFEERPSQNGIHRTGSSHEDRVMQSFRAKSELLISQVNEMNFVEYDDNISSDEEIVQNHWNGNGTSTATTTPPSSKTFVSQIPRPSKMSKHSSKQSKEMFSQNGNHVSSSSEETPIQQFESNRKMARNGARTAEMNVREVSNRMKELEQHIILKESLIEDLMKSEKEARATSTAFRTKLSKLEKEYEKSKTELEEAQDKITQFEKSNNKDSLQKSKLESEFKKKFKEMQRRLEDLKQKENVSNRITSYQENNEKKVKDLEAWIGRMKNQHIELDRKLKEESERKSKYEQELRRNEIRIKELELKTDQQQKLLKRKNEEVVAAQRKLRVPCDSVKGGLDPTEQKKQWIDAEIDKVMIRQRDMEVLEAELHERDESLKKKEMLMTEKEHLEIKRTRSSQNLSKSIMHLSVQVESVDEKIQQLTNLNKNKFNKDLQHLEKVKEELTVQRKLLEENEGTGGLDPNETRRLIELGEAIEAVDEAIQFKNDLILEKQSTINNNGEINEMDNPEHVERIIREMGDLTSQEYKHLLGKQLFKIIELRKTQSVADTDRCHFEMRISDSERKIYDLQRMLQVSERRHEKVVLEQNSKYEKDIQFLMAQLRFVALDASKENVPLEKKVNQLEKELYYYKTRARKHKEQKKEANERDETTTTTTSSESMERKSSSESNRTSVVRETELLERKASNESNHSNRGTSDGEDFRLPTITSHHLLMKKDSSEKKLMDHHNSEDTSRLQEIFESKVPSSNPSINNSSSKRNGKKKAKDDIYQGSINPDSMEVSGKNPWIH